MYSFEGEFKRKPPQSFGGASKKLERNELLNKVSADRHQREEKRRHNHATILIQAFFRGVHSRRNEQEKQRLLFDDMCKEFDCISNIKTDELGKLTSRLIFFYEDQRDINRLEWLSRHFVKESSTLLQDILNNQDYWLHKIKKMLVFNLFCLRNCTSQTYSITTHLRFLEVFTFCTNSTEEDISEKESANSCEMFFSGSSNSLKQRLLDKVFTYLIKNSYFSILHIVIDHRVPSSLITSPNSPTPLAATLLRLLYAPFYITSKSSILFVQALLTELFTDKFSHQIRCFVLPAFVLHSDIIPTDVFLSSLLSGDSPINFTTSVWILYTVIVFITHRITTMTEQQIVHYLHVLKYLIQSLPCPSTYKMVESTCNAESDDDDIPSPRTEGNRESAEVINEVIDLINNTNHVHILLKILEDENVFEDYISPLCAVCHFLLDKHKLAIFNFRLLYTLSFKPAFLRRLWSSVVNTCAPSVFGSATPLVQYLSRGITLSYKDQKQFLPQLTLFCALTNHVLSTLHDFEFYGGENSPVMSVMPFTLRELAAISSVLRDVCMGLIDLSYPETRPLFNDDYAKAMQSVGAGSFSKGIDYKDVKNWNQLFKYIVILLRHLYSRDARCKFCPEGQWIAKQFSISFHRAAELHFSNRKRYGYEPFVGLHPYTKEELEEEGPPPSATEVRQIAILREFPFVIHFHDRVKIFQSLITKDKDQNQGELSNFRMGPQIHALVRRNFIYEDAFDNLSLEPNLKLKVLVQLVNAVGLDEVGIDGGGIFREFLNELLKTCFDPNRGLFKTTHDCQLYPNPAAHKIVSDFTKHYYFIGRMLGKAIYENMLVELPFAEFFLAKVLSQRSLDVDIHHLASLDPVMYKNLLFLKTYSGDVSDLGLDFTVMNSELGENEVIELKPDGANIPVTESNRITYIHLMADYKLNKQIKAQCQAFREGLANIIQLEWLYMFDANELQVLISGAHVPVDIEDLKAHTNYAGGYSPDHPVIQAFWKVVENFDETKRRQLLKFVTSCSRPPLLGFKELTPAFCIQNAGREPNRLPTASTCMNLLKLPEFQDERTLQVKLTYAVESGAGFELS